MAAVVGEVTVPSVLNSSAMTEMVMSNHRNSLLCQENGEGIIPCEIRRSCFTSPAGSHKTVCSSDLPSLEGILNSLRLIIQATPLCHIYKIILSRYK